MNEKVCSKCGAELKESEKFCHKCGEPVNNTAQDVAKRSRENKRKAALVLTGILLGLFVIIIGTLVFIDYSEKREIRLARENFIRDSLEMVRKDSIKNAKVEEQNKIDKARFGNFRKKLTFKNVLDLLNHYGQTSYAEKCGLTLIYEDKYEGFVYGYCYGYEVKKKGDKDIEAMSKYACYIIVENEAYYDAKLYFKDETCAKDFFNEALKYGLVRCGVDYVRYYIPKRKLPNGTVQYNDDWGDYDKISYVMHEPETEDGWSVIFMGDDLCFPGFEH